MGPDSGSPVPTTRPPHSGRKGSKKVRTGCITCKSVPAPKALLLLPFCSRDMPEQSIVNSTITRQWKAGDRYAVDPTGGIPLVS